MTDYTVVIAQLSPEDGGGYVATVPDLPGCISDGETDTEALANAHDAIRAWVECARRLNRPIPQPTRQRQFA